MLTGIGRPGRDKITTWSCLRSLPKISRAHSIQSGQGSSALPLPSLLHRTGPLKILPGQGFQSAVGHFHKGQGSSPFLHAARRGPNSRRLDKADNLAREQREELGVKTEEMDTELWLNYMLDSKLDYPLSFTYTTAP